MKTLLLIRHAKSSWGDLTLADFDRPLNDRGKRDAPKMAKRLYKKDVGIDTFLSSPAVRARKTAEIFADQYGVKKGAIVLVPSLYEAGEAEFWAAVVNAPQESNTIALFSHNPGITEFANRLTDNRIDNMPTSSVFAVRAEVDNWRNFQAARKEFYFFDFPKSADSD